MNKSRFIHTFVTDPDDVAEFLQSLIEGFRNRRMTLSSEDRRIQLKPGEILEMSLETVVRKGRVRMTVSIDWPDRAESRRASGLLDSIKSEPE